MIQHRTFRFEMENFGPIISGSFKLHPLTIFIGPNNSGKSYAAMLVYSIIRALRGDIWGGLIFDFPIPSIPPSLQDLREIINQAISSLILDRLRSYFSCRNLGDLISRFALKRSAQISIYLNDSEYPLIHIVGNGNKWTVQAQTESIHALNEWWKKIEDELSYMLAECDMGFEDYKSVLDTAYDLMEEMWHDLMEDIGIPKAAFYLPAARSGVLQVLIALISSALGQMSRGGQVIEVPVLPGIIGDFLSELIHMSTGLGRSIPPKSHNGQEESLEDFQGVIQILEEEALKGSVDFSSQHFPIREIVFETRWRRRKLAIPIRRASSAILETAPLILWVNYLLQPGDVLIIEEPEAHLHPENQRRMARALVRLVRSGVTVICTTHSPLILHQISNHLLAAQAAPEDRDRVGFTEQDLLDESEVGVYLFRLRKEGPGSEIRPVPIEPGFGIPEDEFVRVYKEIGHETNLLIRSIR